MKKSTVKNKIRLGIEKRKYYETLDYGSLAGIIRSKIRPFETKEQKQNRKIAMRVVRDRLRDDLYENDVAERMMREARAKQFSQRRFTGSGLSLYPPIRISKIKHREKGELRYLR